MILRSVLMEDFGIYRGVVQLDLVPRRRRGRSAPIVLVGGKNGAGKTTLLEAVRLALYGRRALGTRVAKSEYDEFLRGRINRQSGARGAAVGLEFDYAEAGKVHRYRVRREWAARDKSVVETLGLEKDGEPFTSVPAEEWHHFLQELIPPGVSQLFFFDGEKITEIADDKQDSEQLADAVRGLLGIDLVSRLRLDLGLYLARNQAAAGGEQSTLLESLDRDISVANDDIGRLVEEVAELVAQRDSQARAAEQTRRHFIAEGGEEAVNRAKTESRKEEAARTLTRTEQELRDLANKLLPFALAPKLMATIRSILETTARGGGQDGMEKVKAAVAAWKTDDKPERSAKWTPSHWSDLEKFMCAAEPAKKTPALPLNQSAALRELGDGANALARIIEIETSVRPRAIALRSEMDAVLKRQHTLAKALQRADNAASGVLLDELRIADQRLGATEAILKSRQDDLQLIRGRAVTLERERRRALDTQASLAKTSERTDLAARTALALAEYEQQLLQQKVNELSVEFVRRFNELARKGRLVAQVKIDPTTFSTLLVGDDGNEIPKVELSAGEKQIYAVAMLWALAKTSGRPLPMIVDTPLARLDSEHRENLLLRYFPAASHQVILLSTDTEIDDLSLAKLKPFISHAYELDYREEEGCTTVTEGYFNKAGSLEKRRALQQA